MSLLRHLLQRKDIWKRLLVERATEPLHLNFASLFVALFGSTRAKILFDVLVRQHHAFGVLAAAEAAKARGLKDVTVIELGVGSGVGLQNICELAERVSKATQIAISVVGFDTGVGMPPPRDYRDHPELYQAGWFPMDQELLRSRLPKFATLILGDVRDTLPSFLDKLSTAEPIGFVTLDVDYYSSSVDALLLFLGKPDVYLPVVQLYVDDISMYSHNPACGELLAIREFNASHGNRQIAFNRFLPHQRIFKHAEWLTHMYSVHILDHPLRTTLKREVPIVSMPNPYLDC